MSAAFLLLTHKDPGQIRRLAAAVAPSPVFVHVDSRAPEPVYGPLREMEEEGAIRLLPRFKSGWASWGLVAATLSGLAVAIDESWSHIVVMSGQDYPLWPIQAISDFLASKPEQSWIHQAAIPAPPRRIGDADGGVGRIRRWTLTIRGRHLRSPVKRSLPSGLRPHYGQQQCCLAKPLVGEILGVVAERPELARYFRHTQAPDELMIPTLAMSSSFADRVSDENLWYMDWSGGGAHPKTLLLEDYESLATHAREGGDMCGPSPVKLFARKLDAVASRELLDRMDRDLLGMS